MRHVTSPIVVIAALSLLMPLAACGSSSAVPQTASEVVDGLVSALVEGDQAKLGAMMLNASDVEELIAAAGDELSDKKITRAREGVKKNAERLTKAWGALTEGAKSAGVDLTKLKAGAVSEESEVKRGTTSLRIKSTLTDGERTHDLVMKAMKTSRGLVLSRPPRVRWTSNSGSDAVFNAVFEHQRALLNVVETNKDDAKAADTAVDAYLRDNAEAIAKAKADMSALMDEAKKNDPEGMMKLLQAGAEKMSELGRQQSSLSSRTELSDVLRKVEKAMR